MSIENRNLKAGTKLVATYKGNNYGAEVVKGTGGLLYRLGDDREFKSPSSAGSAIMGGKACNGWKFWSIAEAARPTVKTSKTRAEQAKPPAVLVTESASGGEAEPE